MINLELLLLKFINHKKPKWPVDMERDQILIKNKKLKIKLAKTSIILTKDQKFSQDKALFNGKLSVHMFLAARLLKILMKILMENSHII